ncbi:hypothetical protein L3X38_033121 [Prunus dulcis]|uniref:Uncharacterized protein n=1 Tax=Prunus dulcis TaxID=3755 RepID=A0AAD4VFK3_PRUDU|nr:hypothetical protein L3X38_033121 [Prunus dulcis]
MAITLQEGKQVNTAVYLEKEKLEKEEEAEKSQEEENYAAMPTPSPLKPYVPLIPFPQRLKKSKIDGQSSNFLEMFKKVDTLIFPVDFLFLDMEEDPETQLILGHPFLITGRTLIDVEKWLLTLRIGNEKATFKVFEPVTFQGKAEEKETSSHPLVHAAISKADKPRVIKPTLYLDEPKPYDPGRNELKELQSKSYESA